MSNASFGAVLFDTGEDGPGWACRDAGEPFRFNEAVSLGTHTIWWSNLSWDAYKGIFSTWIRPSTWLPGGQESIITEWGWASLTAVERVSRLATVAGLVGRWAVQLFDEKGLSRLTRPTLIQDLAPLFGAAEQPPANVGEVTKGALQPMCLVSNQNDGEPMILRRPRRMHGGMVIDTRLPGGVVRALSRNGLPAEDGTGARAKWIVERGLPSISLIRIERASPSMALIAFRQSYENRNQHATWACDTEISVLREHARIEVISSFVFESERSVTMDMSVAAADWFKRPDHVASWACGMIIDVLWQSAAHESRGRARDVVPWICPFLRATDRITLHQDVVRLEEAGWKVKSYGRGKILISVPHGQEVEAALFAFGIGLIPDAPSPGSGERLRIATHLQEVGALYWGGQSQDLMLATLHARGLWDQAVAFDRSYGQPESARELVRQVAEAGIEGVGGEQGGRNGAGSTARRSELVD